eukprot:351100-Amphidinium_carterae.1
MDSKTRLAAALRARNRRSAPVVSIGQAVYVWRQPPGQRGAWQGPGLVTMVTDRACWVNVRHALWKVPPEHVRTATPEEAYGIEILNKYLSSMQQELRATESRRGPKKYVDGMSEPGPDVDLDETEVVETRLSQELDGIERENREPEREQEGQDQHLEEERAVLNATELEVPMETEIDENPWWLGGALYPPTAKADVHPSKEAEGGALYPPFSSLDGHPGEALNDNLAEGGALYPPSSSIGEAVNDNQGAGRLETDDTLDDNGRAGREMDDNLDDNGRAGREMDDNLGEIRRMEERAFAAEAAIIRDVLQRAEPLRVPATAQRRTNQEHPEEPARQRPRVQTFPYPTPPEWNYSGARTYLQMVEKNLAPGEHLVSFERRGKGARAAVTDDAEIPRRKVCRRRITVDWLAGTVLQDLDLTKPTESKQLHRRWPAH